LRKFYLIAAVYLLIGGIFSAYAQDLIILRDGSVIEAKVMELSPSEIRYKRFNHLDGPMIVIPAANVLSIRYENGMLEVINTVPANIPQTNTPSSVSQASVPSSDSRAGIPPLLQQALNLLPEVPIPSVGNLKFVFHDDTYTAKLNGNDLLAGTLTAQDTAEGVMLTLKQTHTVVRGRRIRTPGPDIVLEYKRGPPASFRVVPRSERGATDDTTAQTGRWQANAVPVATVTRVTVRPRLISVPKGWTQQFSAMVSGINDPPQEVTWSLSGASSEHTKIGSNGVLTIDAGETSTKLTVQATSKFNAQISGAVVVAVRDTSVTAVSVRPGTASVDRTRTQQFSATVSGTNNPPKDVIWSVSGALSENTTISSDGLLKVGAYEFSPNLTVRATSRFDRQISETVVVTVPPPPVHSFSVEGSVWGVGLRYEGNVSNFFALGATVFYNDFKDVHNVGVLATTRLFMGRSPLYVGLGMGWGMGGGVEHWSEYYYSEYYYIRGMYQYEVRGYYTVSGFMLNPAIGMKFGRQRRGFITDVFINFPIVFGERKWIDYAGGPKGTESNTVRFGIGMGGTW